MGKRIFWWIGIYILFNYVSSERDTSDEDAAEFRMINGNIAKSGQFPYVGILAYFPAYMEPGKLPHWIPPFYSVRRQYTTPRFMCVGSIIHKRWGLTAAHCVFHHQKAQFIVGGLLSDGSDGTRYPIAKFYVHGGFHEGVAKMRDEALKFAVTLWRTLRIADIALMKLSRDIEFSATVEPVRLDTEPQPSLYVGHGISVGWGIDRNTNSNIETLMYIENEILTTEQCAFASEYDLLVWREEHVCVLMSDKGGKTCKGDSGGPLMNRNIQIGVRSMSFCSNGKPALAIRVGRYFDWIRKTMIACGDDDLLDFYKNINSTTHPVYTVNKDRCQHPEKYAAEDTRFPMIPCSVSVLVDHDDSFNFTDDTIIRYTVDKDRCEDPEKEGAEDEPLSVQGLP